MASEKGERVEASSGEPMGTAETIAAPSESATESISTTGSSGGRSHGLMVGIFLLGTLYTLYFGRPILLPIVLALLLNLLLKPVMRILGHMRIPNPVGAVIVLVVLVGIVSLALVRLTEPAMTWVRSAPEHLARVETKIAHLLKPAEELSKAAEQVEKLTSAPESTTPKVQVKRTSLADQMFGYTTSFIIGALETVVLLFFLLASGDILTRKIIKVLPSLREKKEVVEIAHELEHEISRYLFTITMINTAEGILVGSAMALAGMPNPVLWGVMAGVLNFVPYLGFLATVTVLTLVAFLTFDTPGRFLLPPGLYLGINFVEANFITPWILGHRLTIHPIVIFISLMFWGWLWGITGALLAVPILMVIKILCDHLKPLNALGNFIEG